MRVILREHSDRRIWEGEWEESGIRMVSDGTHEVVFRGLRRSYIGG